jgi:penicillin-binding protein 1C
MRPTESLLSSRTFLLLCASHALFAASFNMMLPELPAYLSSLGGSEHKGLIIALFTLTAGISRPFSGKLTDSIGRLPVMYIGVLACVLCGLLYPVLVTVGGFLALRFLHGFSTGFKPTGTSAYVADIVPTERRGEAMGWLGICLSLGASASPLFGSWLVQAQGINAMFYASVLLALLSILILAQLPETLPQRQPFRLGLLKIGRHDVFDPLALPAAVTMLFCYFSYGVILTLVPDLSDQLGVANRGSFFAIFTLASISTRFTAGKLSDRLGREPVLKASALLIGVSMLVFASAGQASTLFLASALFGLGNGVFSPAINAWTVDLGNPQHKGRALATMYIALEIAIGGGAWFAGWYFADDVRRMPQVFWLAAAMSFGGWAYLHYYTRFLKSPSPPPAQPSPITFSPAHFLTYRLFKRNWGFAVHHFLTCSLSHLKRHPGKTAALALVLLLWLFCLPRPLFDKPLSVVLESRDGQLLGARIASDGQWRFPVCDTVPEKYAACVVAFEDKRFWWHPGVDPLSLARACWLNLRRQRVVSGGSTLTMQVIRLARDNPSRSLPEKALEMFMATRLELGYSKRAILGLYASNAPFGGNVVGLEAASWRYYGKKPALLTWAEAATLAVLPNSPALIHPGRNRAALLAKRNALLQRLRDMGTLGDSECALAQEEPLPEAPLPLPQLAPHLLDRLAAGIATARDEARFRSTLDKDLQERVSAILARRQAQYCGNDIHNLAALVLDVQTGEALAYVGNVVGAGKEHGESVDIISAPRSTGSILKPYLYALALESGDVLPNSLLRDVPTQLGQYKPENYYETYDGAVQARRALIRSLNVPFVLLLRDYGLEKFHYNLQRLGLSTLDKSPEHYGLSLILGGAEATLGDITNSYACMARRLGLFYERNGRYVATDFRPPRLLLQGAAPQAQRPPTPPSRPAPANGTRPQHKALNAANDLLSAGAIWHSFEAMREVERPNSAGEWELFRASRHIAWKTGTSFGFRDAWAAGVTPRYAVGVWVGNADGEGRPGLIGVDMAAPVLFEIFEQLPGGEGWFDPPYDDMAQAAMCRQSGHRAGPHCETDTLWIPKTGLRAPACPYHQLLHLDASGQWQVHSDCEAPATMQHRGWFVLPPIEEFYFRHKNPAYVPPPPFRPDCLGAQGAAQQNPMQLIYPKDATRIYVPLDLSGKLSSTIFQVAHRDADTEIHWHLDGSYLGSTRTFHQMALQPAVGHHTLALVDKAGFRIEQRFEIIGK